MHYTTRPISLVPFAAFYVAAALFVLPWFGTTLSQEEEVVVEIDHTRIADYDIQVNLETQNRQLKGKETITWTNSGGAATDTLKFHLYMNAFRSADTRFFEHGGSWTPEDAGWIDVTSVSITGGQDLTDRMSVDETVMTVALPTAVEHGARITLEIDFEVKIPHVFARSGYSEEYYLIAQWFPKIGVYLDGRWICPQYHSHSEYFSDFGQYHVEITVPKNFEVAATGIRERGITEPRTKTVVYSAYPVHDFAWTASPFFRRTKRTMSYSVDGQSKKLEVHLLLDRDKQAFIENYAVAVQRALETFGRDYGEFPYPKLVVVDPAQGRGLRTGGMEYPMLITGGNSWLENTLATGEKGIEQVTAHEFGHQYWYGAVANNEFDEAWIDEGLTTYTSNKVIDTFGPFTHRNNYLTILGSNISALHPFQPKYDFSYGTFAPLMLLGMVTDTFSDSRRTYLAQPDMDPVRNESYRPYNGQAYQVSAYSKPDLMLRTLERIIGTNTMNRALKRFYTEFRWRHPRSEDFEGLISEIAGRNMDWFFEQFSRSNGKLDYAVTTVSSKKEITIERLGEAIVPQKIAVTLEKGETLSFEWRTDTDSKVWMDDFRSLEGHQNVRFRIREGENRRWLKIALDTSNDIVSAQVDPQYLYLLDIDLSNNSLRMARNTGFASRAWLKWWRLVGRWIHGIGAYS